jgi:GDP-mannose pyrophosphatase NudK
MNQAIKIEEAKVLSHEKYLLRKIRYAYTDGSGRSAEQVREVYDRGDGAAILLYNRAAGTVILTRQFRLPTYLNGNATGLKIEVCAGLLDRDRPEEAIRRETEEETGYRVGSVTPVYDMYTSPGVLTEIVHCFIAEYSAGMKVGEGGGLEEEQEEIEVMEIAYERALQLMRAGEIKDAKTIVLLQYLRVEGVM